MGLLSRWYRTGSITSSNPMGNLQKTALKNLPQRIQHFPVGGPRLVMFPFIGEKALNQVSVLADQVVHVVEDCSDGWSLVETSKGVKGIIPTNHLGTLPRVLVNPIPANVPNDTRNQKDAMLEPKITSSLADKLMYRSNVMSKLFIQSAQGNFINLVTLFFVTCKVILADIIIPLFMNLVGFVTKSKLSSGISDKTLKLYYGGFLWLIPFLSDYELEFMSSHLKNTIENMRGEISKRKQA